MGLYVSILLNSLVMIMRKCFLPSSIWKYESLNIGYCEILKQWFAVYVLLYSYCPSTSQATLMDVGKIGL